MLGADVTQYIILWDSGWKYDMLHVYNVVDDLKENKINYTDDNKNSINLSRHWENYTSNLDLLYILLVELIMRCWFGTICMHCKMEEKLP